MTTKLLYLFTRTPLHVGAGSSVGAIDQPIVRERHTGFPIIPASSLKGSFADQWPTGITHNVRLKTRKEKDQVIIEEVSDAAWLFGSDEAGDTLSAAGALLFGEARLLAFPIRSAKGSFAWITSPTLLRRAVRDGVFPANVVAAIKAMGEPGDEQALFANGKLDLTVVENNQNVHKVVLEEYTFTRQGDLPLNLGPALQTLISGDPVWAEIASRLVILSDGQMSFFATTACEVAQHVRINDETGTAAHTGLFNQENVPSETLFYGVVRATDSRLKGKAYEGSAHTTKNADDAAKVFAAKVTEKGVFQFGGGASTGLGYCSPLLANPTANA